MCITSSHYITLFKTTLLSLRLSVCDHADIRLVNGAVSYEGRVEVCVNNTWGTVCDDFWGAPDAMVVCRQAGFQATGAVALGFSRFGQGIDPILLDDVRCIGTETTLLDCPYNPNHNCIHLEDAGVRCIPCKYISILSELAMLRIQQKHNIHLLHH